MKILANAVVVETEMSDYLKKCGQSLCNCLALVKKEGRTIPVQYQFSAWVSAWMMVPLAETGGGLR